MAQFLAVKALPRQQALGNRKMTLKFGLYDYSTNWVTLKYNRKGRLNFLEDQSYLVKIVLVMHNRRSQADIAQNTVDRSP